MVSIKLVGLVVVLAAVSLTKAAENDKEAKIISQTSELDPDGKYYYSFETDDGTKAQQNGAVKQLDKDNTAEVVQGQYSYTDKDGKAFSVSYIADENGYHARGDHLPVAPEIPPLIARALQYIAEHPQKEEVPSKA